MKNTRISQSLRAALLTPSMESEGEGVVKVELQAVDETPADGAGAPAEDKDLTVTSTEVGESSELAQAETEVKGDEVTSAETTVENAEQATAEDEGLEVSAESAEGVGEEVAAPSGEAVVHAEAKPVDETPADGAGAPGEDAEVTATVEEVGERSDLEAATTEVTGDDVTSAETTSEDSEVITTEEGCETVSQEGLKGAVGGVIATIIPGLGVLPGGIMGHELEERAKKILALEEQLKEAKAELKEAGKKAKSSNESVDDADAAASAAAAFAEGAAGAAEAAAAAVAGDDAAVVVEGDVEGDVVVNEADLDSEIAAGDADLDATEGDITDAEEAAAEYEEGAATMEALIDALQDAQRAGGMTPQSARFFTIGFESVGTRLTGAPFVDETGGSLIPSLESFGGTMRRDRATDISMEAAQGWLAKIWEVLKKIWAQIVEWCGKFAAAVFSQTARYGQRADALIAASGKLASAKPKSTKVNIGASADRIAIGHAVKLDSLGTLLKLADLAGKHGANAEAYMQGFLKLLQDVSGKLKSLRDGDKAWQQMVASSIDLVVGNLEKGNTDQLFTAVFHNRKTEGVMIQYSTDVLPGNVRLVATSTETNMDAEDLDPRAFVKSAFAKAIKQGKTVVESEDITLTDAERELPVLSASDIGRVGKEVKAILAAVEQGKAEMSKLRSDFSASIPHDDDQSNLSRALIQGIAQSSGKRLSDWAGSISKSYKYTVSACGGYLDYAAASAKQYA